MGRFGTDKIEFCMKCLYWGGDTIIGVQKAGGPMIYGKDVFRAFGLNGNSLGWSAQLFFNE